MSIYRYPNVVCSESKIVLNHHNSSKTIFSFKDTIFFSTSIAPKTAKRHGICKQSHLISKLNLFSVEISIAKIIWKQTRVVENATASWGGVGVGGGLHEALGSDTVGPPVKVKCPWRTPAPPGATPPGHCIIHDCRPRIGVLISPASRSLCVSFSLRLVLSVSRSLNVSFSSWPLDDPIRMCCGNPMRRWRFLVTELIHEWNLNRFLVQCSLTG